MCVFLRGATPVYFLKKMEDLPVVDYEIHLSFLQDTLIEKLRLKNSTLKVQKKKLHLQLKQVSKNHNHFDEWCFPFSYMMYLDDNIGIFGGFSFL